MKNIFNLKTAQHMGQPPQMQEFTSQKTYCPNCKAQMDHSNVMNPSHPTIYKCKCGKTFNPDNVGPTTPGMNKQVSQTPGMAGNGGMDSGGTGMSLAGGNKSNKTAQRYNRHQQIRTEWDDMPVEKLYGKFAVVGRDAHGSDYIEDVYDTIEEANATAQSLSQRTRAGTYSAVPLDDNFEPSLIISYIDSKAEEERESIQDSMDLNYSDDPDYDQPIDGVGFSDPGGNSALRAETEDNPRNLPCPNCGRPNALTPIDAQKGYQCDTCANQAEGHYGSGKKSLFNLKIAQQQMMNAKTKQMINQKFVEVGLDGNGRFEKPGRILNAIGDVLHQFGMTLTDTQDLHSFPENQARAVIKSLRVNMAATDDPFTPGPEIGSQVHVQYTMMGPYQYEAVAYMT